MLSPGTAVVGKILHVRIPQHPQSMIGCIHEHWPTFSERFFGSVTTCLSQSPALLCDGLSSLSLTVAQAYISDCLDPELESADGKGEPPGIRFRMVWVVVETRCQTSQARVFWMAS